MDSTGLEGALAEGLDEYEADDVVVVPAKDLPDDRYLDREISWLRFNQRVLELAEDEATPLLERANFAAIFASNLDEFFMVRVAGLKRRIVTGLAVPTNVGIAPQEVYATISAKAHELQERHARGFNEQLKPALREAGIHIEQWADLGARDRARIDEVFRAQIFPVLMPLAVDPAHPFPYISGLSLSLSVRVRNPRTDREEFARVKVPTNLPRFFQLPEDGTDRTRFIALEDLIGNHLHELFPGMEILDHHAFRVTRNEDVEVDEDESENLIKALEQQILNRRFGPPIRLEISQDMDLVTLELLVRELDITEQEVYRLDGPLDLRGLFQLGSIDRPSLKYPRHVPTTSVSLLPSEANAEHDVFGAIARGDILLHHPYESFSTSVQAFIEAAAHDPSVLAIKQTLYRTSGDSPIVEALIDAAESGKAVLALVELKARFDEAANIQWAKKLERAGVHVVYGIVGLKTHSKLALVVRQEGGRLRRYSHIGTGNYNPKTARVYEDLGLLTASEEVGEDLARLFNELSGYAMEQQFDRLLVAPVHLRAGLIECIRTEADHARAGRPSGIRLKMNAIVDEAIIDELYRASQAGVPVDLVVRGICGLRPGVPGYSDNIRVRSILGRYLEHSRIFSFENAGDPVVYIGSADMLHRNLDRRIEVLVRITDAEHLRDLSSYFDLQLDDLTSSWHLDGESGEWVRHSRAADGTLLDDAQDVLMARIAARRRSDLRGTRTGSIDTIRTGQFPAVGLG
ncbi:MAG TPA: RNA degradosome polyphosphate kinase [Microbacteriaceae bacterium]|nr:RNA degradosome polyphosphate kinase [Microbacteriaceae bacterium]